MPPSPHPPRPLGGAAAGGRQAGLGRTQRQDGEATAPCSAVAGPPRQERPQPTYQHPRRPADDAAALPSLPGSLPSPQAQPALTFTAKCVSTILNNTPRCGYSVRGTLTTAIKLRLGRDHASVPGCALRNVQSLAVSTEGGSHSGHSGYGPQRPASPPPHPPLYMIFLFWTI